MAILVKIRPVSSGRPSRMLAFWAPSQVLPMTESVLTLVAGDQTELSHELGSR